MRVRSAVSFVSGFVLACMTLLPAARADEWNQMTKLSFSQPIEIPGSVLPAGSYWFVLENSPCNRNVVEVFTSDWSKELARFITMPSLRQQSTNRTEFTFAERPQGRPDALLNWYYPGSLNGLEFLYSSRHEREFAHDVQQDVITQPMKNLGRSQ